MHPGELRQIPLAELTAGMVLPGHLRDEHGRVLMRAGRVLHQHQLDALRLRPEGTVCVARDWLGTDLDETAAPPPGAARAPSDEESQARCRRTGAGMRHRLRRHPRRTLAMRLRLSILERGPKGSRSREIDVLTRDISVSGFSFVYRQFLHPGTAVLATFDRLPGRPRLSGVVRNCTHLTACEHRIGVEFTGPPGE